MKISTKSRYGLRILLQIAQDMEKKINSQGKSIAKQQDISEAYLEQIMIPLKNNGFVRTQRGCKGGYILNKDPEEVTVLDLIETFEGRVSLVECVDKKDCSRQDLCFTSEVWARLSDSFRKEASSITLADILENAKNRPKVIDFVI